MRGANPADDVIKILLGAGYRQLPVPLAIQGVRVQFDFDAALVGPARLADLVVVVDTATEASRGIKEKVEGLARALDLGGSRRPLTCVLVGPRPKALFLDSLSKVCRTLPVGDVSEKDYEKYLLDWLSILLPIEVPKMALKSADPLDELSKELGNARDQVLATQLLKAAKSGQAAVQDELITVLSSSFKAKRA